MKKYKKYIERTTAIYIYLKSNSVLNYEVFCQFYNTSKRNFLRHIKTLKYYYFTKYKKYLTFDNYKNRYMLKDQIQSKIKDEIIPSSLDRLLIMAQCILNNEVIDKGYYENTLNGNKKTLKNDIIFFKMIYQELRFFYLEEALYNTYKLLLEVYNINYDNIY